MSANGVFLASVGLAIFAYFRWGFVNLPGDKGQMLAVIHAEKAESAGWNGITWRYPMFSLKKGRRYGHENEMEF